MKSRQISPALTELLSELALRPDSMLFGRGKTPAPTRR
jgi:hypothetical protein